MDAMATGEGRSARQIKRKRDEGIMPQNLEPPHVRYVAATQKLAVPAFQVS
jgi:hypothetical protein